MFRNRVHTLAVMNTVKKPTGSFSNSNTSQISNRGNQMKEPLRSGINPR